jgi:hypothetical protein
MARSLLMSMRQQGGLMNHVQLRTSIARNILRSLGLASLSALALTVGCGSDGEGGGSDTGGGDDSAAAGGDGSYETMGCVPWPNPDWAGTGGFGAGGGNGGFGGGNGGFGGGNGGFGGGGGEVVAECPPEAQAQSVLSMVQYGCLSVDGPGVYADGQCCYPATAPGNCPGRPFVVDAVALRAPVRAVAASPWSAPISPRVEGLSTELRAALAAAWTRDAQLEHASVASFARFALELMAVGAPAELVAATHQAALDEIQHARLCFGLASAYSGGGIEPAELPIGERLDIRRDLASVAAAAVREGCIGETLAAMLACEQLASATDPCVRAVLSTIAADEGRHAELAWRAVAWAIRVGGPTVAESVRAAFDEALAAAVGDDSPMAPERDLRLHGQVGAASRKAASRRAVNELIAPAAAALLVSALPADKPPTRAADKPTLRAYQKET